MNTFEVSVLDSQDTLHFPRVRRFIGADSSGSFGVLAGHRPLVVVLRHGLARLQDDTGQWHYLALPGGVLTMDGRRLRVATVRCHVGTDRDAIVGQLETEMSQTDSQLQTSRSTLREIEHALVRRLGELSEGGPLEALR